VAEQSIAGSDAPLTSWAQVRERIEEGIPQPRYTHWLATVRPDGRPHVMPVGVIWVDGAFCFQTGASTRKGKNLARNSHCVITVALPGLDLVVEGEAAKVRDDAKLHRVADVYASHGWHPTVRDGALYADYSAPSAGPPPWDVYELTPTTAFGLGTDEPYGATRWRF